MARYLIGDESVIYDQDSGELINAKDNSKKVKLGDAEKILFDYLLKAALIVSPNELKECAKLYAEPKKVVSKVREKIKKITDTDPKSILGSAYFIAGIKRQLPEEWSEALIDEYHSACVDETNIHISTCSSIEKQKAYLDILKIYEDEYKKYGYPPAANSIGLYYQNGWGVEKNYSKAFEYYMKAALAGYGSAQENVGDLYVHGCGTEKNLAEAARWFKLAAEQNDYDACFRLACILEKCGWDGTAPDRIAAQKYKEIAETHGVYSWRFYSNYPGVDSKNFKL